MKKSEDVPLSLRRAFDLVYLGTRTTIVSAARNADDDAALLLKAALALLLKAALAQMDGRIDASIGMLRIGIRQGRDAAAIATFAEVLAPILVMRHDAVGVSSLAAFMREDRRFAIAYAFEALAATMVGSRDQARRLVDRAVELIQHDCHDAMRLRVLQRASLASFRLNDIERARDLALAACMDAVALESWRPAAACYSILYNIEHGVTGDFASADRYAVLARQAAQKAGDRSFEFGCLVAEFELAVKFGDESRATLLEDAMEVASLPQQYRERFAMVFSKALRVGAKDLGRMRTLLEVSRDTDGRSRGEWAMCTALIALVAAASGDDFETRRLIEATIGRLGRSSSREPAFEQHYRRLSRALIATCCVLMGDHVRAARVVGVGEMHSDPNARELPRLADEGRFAEAALEFRGVALVILNVTAQRRASLAPGGLTVAQFEVLRLLGKGWSAGRIARETGRSINTVYNHTRAILGKFDVTRSAEAVAEARNRGFLN